MNASCTCNSKSFLHMSTCAMVARKEKGAFKQIRQKLLASPNLCLFYIADTDDHSILRSTEFLSQTDKTDWLYDMQLESVVSVSMVNGSEITFMPQSESFFLMDLPKGSSAFLETFPGWEDINTTLQMSPLSNIILVDVVTNEVLSVS